MLNSYNKLSCSHLDFFQVFSNQYHHSGFYWSKDDGSGGDSWSYIMCKAPVKSSPQTLSSYRPDALPVAPPTLSESEYCTQQVSHSKDSPTPSHNISQQVISTHGVTLLCVELVPTFNQSINQSISLIATLRPESRIANDMQLKK